MSCQFSDVSCCVCRSKCHGCVSVVTCHVAVYRSRCHRCVSVVTCHVSCLLEQVSWVCQFNDVSCCCLQEQASWVCQCNDAVVHQLEQDFKKTLQQQNSLEQWADWLEGVVNQVLKVHEGSADFPKAARQFLLKWSFYRWGVVHLVLGSYRKTVCLH